MKVNKKNFFLYLIIYLFIHFNSESQNIKEEEGKSQKINILIKEIEEKNHGIVGFKLYNPKENKIYYSYNEEKNFIPASNVKLLTFYSALIYLKTNIPSLKYLKINDSIRIWGCGDPVLFSPKFKNEKNFFHELFLDSVKNITISLNNFKDKKWGMGWMWDDFNYYFSTEKSSMPINGNFVEIKMEYNKQKKENELIVEPNYFLKYFQLDTTLNKNFVLRDEKTNQFLYNPRNYKRKKYVPFIYNLEDVLQIIYQNTLKKVMINNIEMDKNSKLYYGIELEKIYKEMIKESDNFIAEQILYLIACENNQELETMNIIKKIKKDIFELPLSEIKYDTIKQSYYDSVILNILDTVKLNLISDKIIINNEEIIFEKIIKNESNYLKDINVEDLERDEFYIYKGKYVYKITIIEDGENNNIYLNKRKINKKEKKENNKNYFLKIIKQNKLEIKNKFIIKEIIKIYDPSDYLYNDTMYGFKKEKIIPFNWVDGSGLSRYNLISPYMIVKILEKIKNIINDDQKLLSYFPLACKEGTLEHLKCNINNYIYAKSGSMYGVYNLSGYIKTKSENLLIFSIMNNNFIENSEKISDDIIKVLEYVYENY